MDDYLYINPHALLERKEMKWRQKELELAGSDKETTVLKSNVI